jgi:predicted DNA-binding transcriptional regulator AlpA
MNSPTRAVYPPRGLRVFDAAAYLGMSRSKFLELVESGKLPRPIAIDAMRVWDRIELDAAFDAIKAEPERTNSFDAILGLSK